MNTGEMIAQEYYSFSSVAVPVIGYELRLTEKSLLEPKIFGHSEVATN